MYRRLMAIVAILLLAGMLMHPAARGFRLVSAWSMSRNADPAHGDAAGRRAPQPPDLSTAGVPSPTASTSPASHESASPGNAPTCSPPPREPDLARLTLASAETRLPGTDRLERVRLVESDLKYPFLRISETVARNSATGRETVLARTTVVADHVLVRVRPDIRPEQVDRMASKFGFRVRKAMPSSGLYLIAANSVTLDTIPRLLNILGSDGRVLCAEPDAIVYVVDQFPNDPSFGSLWGLHNTGQSGGTADADIDAPEAWSFSTGGTSVVVAVIDSGVDWTHADLASNMFRNPLETVNGIDDDGNGYTDDIRGWDFYNNDSNPADDFGHGTHVAGTIAAAGSNGVGVVGVNWTGLIMPLKSFSASGSGYTSDNIEAIYYTIGLRQRGVNVLLSNNSWGGGPYESLLAQAILASEQAGMLFMAAAGNNGSNNDTTSFYPANYPWSNVLSIAATDQNDARAGFSNYGRTTVDLGAPGVGILSTTPGNAYGYNSGTSMATPHVSGVAALLWSLWPDASITDIRNAILGGTDPIPALAPITVTGGRLNAAKAMNALFRIIHTPVTVVLNEGPTYPINAAIVPDPLVNLETNLPSVLWNTSGPNDPLNTAIMNRLSNGIYQAGIPTQQVGATVYYYIQAVSQLDTNYRFHPTNAPSAMHSFSVRPAVSLTVTGTPSEAGSVSPAYGNSLCASGSTVQASAPAFSAPNNAQRWRCTGWTGLGSAPAIGTSNAFSFVIEEDSAIAWQWQLQFSLVQTSSPPFILNTSTWWDADTTAVTVTATSTATVGGTNYAFAYWNLDGLRQPDSSNSAAYTVAGILMSTSRVAEAVYLPATDDKDGDGIADWWECFYFGSTSACDPAADSDGDGASNLQEFRDRSDPRLATSIPQSPIIVHSPLTNPQMTPAPYAVSAQVTDNDAVSNVMFRWRRNGGAYVATNMSLAVAPSAYTASIPAPGTNSDTFSYLITASDRAGNVTTSGPWDFAVVYSILSAEPASFTNVLIKIGTGTNLVMNLANTGNTNMAATVSLSWAGAQNDFEHGAPGWTHGGTADLWNISTRRSFSLSNAWYCGSSASGLYANSMHSMLYTPPIPVATGGKLVFRHWIKTELDTYTGQPMHAWDGGIVELSTNAGLTFAQIVPEGGYPYQISGWAMSPWPDGTPCFAGAGGWQTVVFDLAAFTGTTAVIRFHFGSDDNTPDEGWYIDDVVFATDTGTNAWLSLVPTGLLFAPGQSSPVFLNLTAGAFPPGNREASVRIDSDSTVTARKDVPVVMKIRAPPVVLPITAVQTSTNGEGSVRVTGGVFDPDGDPCAMRIRWSQAGPDSTQTCRMLSATVTVGAVTTWSNLEPQVRGIATWNKTNFVTNVVASIWNAGTDIPAPGISTATLVTAQAWDGVFWGNTVTSAPFLVDNEPPPAPSGLSSPTHTAGVWSSNTVIRSQWPPVSDGNGVGGVSYLYAFPNSLDGMIALTGTTATQAASSSVSDGTNWWAVAMARDACGNRSAASYAGPFRIDATPPASSNAFISVTLSPFGNYIVSQAAAVSWTGFTDRSSGIQDYGCALTNPPSASNAVWTAGLQCIVSNLVPDRTNRIYVWARDQVGWIGTPISVPVLALSADGDWDGDGFTNGQEEDSGTDARNAASLFRILSSGQTPPGDSNIYVLRWDAVTGRLYSVAGRDTLAPSGTVWQTFSGASNIPGFTGTMSYTDRTDGASMRFYRISVTAP